jgi:hypothetical protein
MSPLIKALYGYHPPRRELIAQEVTVVAVKKDMTQQRFDMDQVLKTQLEAAKHRMKQITDKNRFEREFQLRDQVFLKLQPYRQTGVALRSIKLNPRFHSPFIIIQKVGPIAYKL